MNGHMLLLRPQPPLPQIAGQRFALMDRRIGVADHTGQHIGNVAFGISLLPEMPRHADLMDAAPSNLQRAQPLGNQHFGFDFTAQNG